jgi:hypothetical protein
MPKIFAEVYNETPGIAGLHYISLGVGLTIASQLNARFLDRIYVYYKNKKGGIGEPEFRLREFLFFLMRVFLLNFQLLITLKRRWYLRVLSFRLD